jgi:hypothetical protein
LGAVRRSDAADGRDHQRHGRHRGDSNSAFFVDNARFVIFDDLNTWGWIVLLLGVARFLAAFGIWARTPGVRWFGVACAALNAIAQLLFILRIRSGRWRCSRSTSW